MRDYLLSDLQEASDIDLHTFNSQLYKTLLNAQKRVQESGLIWKIGKKKTKKEGGMAGGWGGGVLETGVCSLRI